MKPTTDPGTTAAYVGQVLTPSPPKLHYCPLCGTQHKRKARKA